MTVKKGRKPAYRKPLKGVVQSLYKYPSKIEFLTTGEIAEFKCISLRSTHRAYDFFVYVYTNAGPKSGKLGMELPLKREDIDDLSRKSYAKFTYDEPGEQEEVS